MLRSESESAPIKGPPAERRCRLDNVWCFAQGISLNTKGDELNGGSSRIFARDSPSQHYGTGLVYRS